MTSCAKTCSSDVLNIFRPMKKRRTESSSADHPQQVQGGGRKTIRDSDSSKSAPSRKTEHKPEAHAPIGDSTASEQIRVKRKEGYAAAEKRMMHRWVTQ